MKGHEPSPTQTAGRRQSLPQRGPEFRRLQKGHGWTQGGGEGKGGGAGEGGCFREEYTEGLVGV